MTTIKVTQAFIGLMPYWWIAIPGVLLGLYAQMKLQATYKRFLAIRGRAGLTGAQAARTILDDAGLNSMPIKMVSGTLSDHYDPMRKQLCLSHDNYHGQSLAALGVAAHEAGHALQHQKAYAMFQLRMFLVPATKFASAAYLPIFLLGMFGNFLPIAIDFIIAIFIIMAFFQLVTLPVEFDASKRAKVQLDRLGLIASDERKGVSKVLNAAAMTYVAALVTSVLELAKFVLIRNMLNDES